MSSAGELIPHVASAELRALLEEAKAALREAEPEIIWASVE